MRVYGTYCTVVLINNNKPSDQLSKRSFDICSLNETFYSHIFIINNGIIYFKDQISEIIFETQGY